MSFIINHIVLVGGNLTRDAELKATQSGKHVFNFDIAMNRNVKNPDGTRGDVAEFFKVVFWCDFAEKVAPYLTKGQKVAIEGRLSQRKYQKDGQDRYVIEVIASNVILIGQKNTGTNDVPPPNNSASQSWDTSPMDDGDAPW